MTDVAEVLMEHENRKKSQEYLVGKVFLLGFVVGGITGLILAYYIWVSHCG